MKIIEEPESRSNNNIEPLEEKKSSLVISANITKHSKMLGTANNIRHKVGAVLFVSKYILTNLYVFQICLSSTPILYLPTRLTLP